MSEQEKLDNVAAEVEEKTEERRNERVSEVIAKTIASEQAQERQEQQAEADNAKKAKKRGFSLKFAGKKQSDGESPASEKQAESGKTTPAAPQSQPVKADRKAKVNANMAMPEVTYQPKQVTLSLARLDAWSVMKTTFLLSVCFGMAMVFSALLLWLILNGMQVFSSLEHFITDIDPSGTVSKLIDYLRLPRVLALSTIVAVSNVVLLSAFMTIGAMLYNLTASLVGGVRVILTDD